ncbi:MAG TPA: hypothetical protein VHV78_18155 [Gemmatimonadaceae bacterium]|jgi:hypothetical protein|nr:hypothetical protein [Gemmatimonadaceae bacterium]
MSDSSSSGARPPAPRLDRAALERVLARAAELQGDPAETGEEFAEEQLVDLGKEVGLSPQHLRQALAEERTKSIVAGDEAGFFARIFGPSRVRAGRTIAGKPDDVLATIDAWMQRQELLVVKRHHSDRIVWEARRDFVVGIKRALKVGGRDYALSLAFEVGATVIAVDDTRVHVALEADFGSHRMRSGGQVLGSTAMGAVATGAMLVMHVAAIVAAAPIVVLPILGVAGARAMSERVVTRAQLALEQLLDRLERGEIGRRPTDSLLGAIVAAATSIPPRRF